MKHAVQFILYTLFDRRISKSVQNAKDETFEGDLVCRVVKNPRGEEKGGRHFFKTTR